MDRGSPVLTVECKEPGGPVVRHLRPARLSTERLRHYWDKLSQFDVLFNDEVHGDVRLFIEQFLAGDGENGVQAKGIIWEVDDVGILYLAELTTTSAQAHFTFWDRRIRGREAVIRAAIKYAFDNYGLHRITCLIPLYAARWLSKTVEKVGFKKEGRAREVARYKGQWFDAIMYSILSHEVD